MALQSPERDPEGIQLAARFYMLRKRYSWTYKKSPDDCQDFFISWHVVLCRNANNGYKR